MGQILKDILIMMLVPSIGCILIGIISLLICKMKNKKTFVPAVILASGIIFLIVALITILPLM